MRDIISLNIETSTTLCSVSVGKNDECVDFSEIDDGVYHAEKLHVLIKELLEKNNLSINEIDVIGISSGPGSYTGLRIGAAAAKTLAYALNVPLIAVSSLQTKCMHFLNQSKADKNIVSTMFARNNKIYYAVYSIEGEEIQSPSSQIILDESKKEFLRLYEGFEIIGSGRKLLFGSNDEMLDFSASSKYMVKTVFDKFQKKKFENLVYFEPMYI